MVNICLQNYIRAFASDGPRTWSKFLYLVEFWYNSSHHSAIAMTPFQALYGQRVPDINRYHVGTATITSIDAALKEHQRLCTVLKENLCMAQQRMTSLANSHRLDK